MNSAGKSTFYSNRKLALIIFSVILAVQIFVLVPLNVYLNNLDEMSVTLLELLKLSLIPTLLLILALVLCGHFVPGGARHPVIVVLATLTILIWVQSNLLLWDYGLLDGRMIDWTTYNWQGWVDVSIWLATLAAALWLSMHHKKVIPNLAVFLFTIQLLALGLLGFQQRDNFITKNTESETALKQLYRFSEQGNVLHLMVDGFQADVFGDLISVPGPGEHYQQAFDGFTYYPETLSVFPYTRFSLPSFLSGKLYANKMPQDAFVDKVLSENTILSLANENGYEVDIAAGSPYLEKRYVNMPHDHMYGLHNIDPAHAEFTEVAELIDIGLFRSVPHFVKPFVYSKQQWFLSRLLAVDSGMRFNYFQHTYFIHRLVEEMSADRESLVYKYIHIMNTHNPMVVGEDCRYAGKVSAMTRYTLTVQSKCTMDTLAALLDKMKELDIYDNSLIIVHADHGGWIGNRRQEAKIVFPNGRIAPEWLASLASPLLAIKLPESRGPVEVSNTLASLADLPDTISDVMGWQADFGHASIYSAAAANPERERLFRYYHWRKTEWSEQYASPIVEFSVTGSHHNTRWQSVNSYYPPEQ